MFTLHDKILKRAGGLFMPLWLAMAFYAGTAMDVRAQLPPANASVTNAQSIFGISGTVYGTNLYVLLQTSKPAQDPLPAQYSIWYEWTAPIAGTFAFDTRNSTDIYGNPLGTVLTVYKLTSGTNVSFANMTLVADDEDDPNPAYTNSTSRVNFAATLGTAYFIQVDGLQKPAPGINAQGYITLNWEPSLVAGGFGFSASVFPFSSLENYLVDEKAGASIYNTQNGSANARITVTRNGAYNGKCEVTLVVGAATYTNIFYTNYLITNLYMTNYSSNMTTVLSWTNIFITNSYSINDFANDVNGVIVYNPQDAYTIMELTNSSTPLFPDSFFTNMPLTTYGLPNFFTNFPCPNVPYNAITIVPNTNGVQGSVTIDESYLSTNLMASNSDGTFTTTVTNIMCITGFCTNVIVAAALNGIDFEAGTYTLTFNDFQMSQDVYLSIEPILGTILAEEPDEAVQDIDTFGLGGIGLVNASVQLTLTNAVLDPNELQDIVPPTITQPTANVDIINCYESGTPVYTNNNGNMVAINFERENFRVNRDVGTAVIWVQTFPRYRATSYTVHYTIDSLHENGDVIDWDNWATVAGADYAVPSDGQAVYDFTLPTNSSWTGWCGDLTFPESPDDSPQPIEIPINNNGSQEFDEDIYVQLFLTTADAGDLTATPPGYLGDINTAHLTINFDNTGDNLQPGGAVDRNWNVDSETVSVPPGNPLPGANGGVGAAVQAVAIQANGEAIIGGSFNSYNDTNVYGIARLLANGFLDTSFNTGSGINNGYVDALAIDASGRVIVGGSFASINNSVTVSNIARLNYNGSVDTSFNSGVGFNGTVFALCIDANSNILAGGDFTSYNTTNCNHIARLLPGGGLDTNFLPNTGNGLAGYGTDQDVFAVATDGNGNIILGGHFSHVNGAKMSYVARLLPSGALDTTFNAAVGADGDVLSVAIETNNNNEILIGGDFQNYDNVSRNSIALIATNGVLDTAFNPGTGADGPIQCIVIQPDGNVLIGGSFTSFNTTRRIGLARLLPQGWLDTSFMDTAYNQFAGFINPYYDDAPNTIYALGLEASGNIIAGGSFTNGVGGGSTRTDIHYHANVAQIIGASTVGYGTNTLTYETGGIGNCPGNVTFTQNPYEALDTQPGLYITLQRTNGSLGPAAVTLGTNLLAAGPGDATAADFALDKTAATFLDLWDLHKNPGAGSYGWRKSDGYSGFNNLISGSDQGNSGLSLYIYNDLTAGENLLADLSLLNVNSQGLLSLGGVPIPTGPALGVPGAELEILNNNLPPGVVGYGATNYTTVNTTSNITITVLRTNGSSGVISVYYYTKDGTARVAAGDYTPTHGQLTFQTGVSAQTFPVTIGNFSTAQPTKYFNLLFSNASPASILGGGFLPTNATVTIIDGSFLPGHLSFTSPTYSVLKGGVASVGVMRSGGALGQLQVQCGTSNGSAINGLNYTGVTNTLSWSNQDVSVKTMTFQTLQDNTVDGNLTNTVFLFNATNIGNTSSNNLILTSPSNAVVTINEVNSYGALSFVVNNFNILQNAGQALITVVRSGGATGTLSVNYTNFSDTNAVPPYLPAQAGTNYGVVSGTLTFGPGVTSQSFAVPIYYTPGESNAANRMVTLELVSGSPSAITNQNTFPIFATLTILDPQLVLSPAGNVDTTTQNGTGFNNDVDSLALQPDGSVLAGGDFTFFNNYPFEFVTRLNPNGDYDGSFLANQVGAGANSNVLQVLSQITNSSQTNNGPIMIAGVFTQVNSVNRYGIARLNLDGSLDESFNPGSGADSTIFAIAETSLPAGISNQPRTLAYYIGGSFANFDGVHCGGITRLNASTNSPGYQGAVDPNFNVGHGMTGSDAVIHALAVQANGQVILGGDFTAFNGVPYNHLIRLNVDGSVDASFNPGTNFGPADAVRAIAIQPDGQILIGGLFTNVGGSNLNYLARLNSADGSVDTNFNVGVGGNNDVLALAIDSQNRILVGGQFTRFSGVTRNGITRLNPDGTVDPTINFGTGADGGFVDTIAIQSNDEIDLGGGFSTFEGITENNFVRLYGGANYGDGSLEFSQAVYGVLQNGTNAVITIKRLGGEGTATQPTVSVVFYTSDGTALAGTDYTGVTNTVTFPLGETFETVTIPIINNDLVSSNKTVNLNLSNPAYAVLGTPASAFLVITNVNSEVGFSSQTYSQTANAPGSNAIITVVRIGNPNTTVGVTVYTGTNGTAAPNVDYTPETNFLVFNPGVMTNYFLVPMLNPTNMFSDQTVDLEMSNLSNTFPGSPISATLTIESVYKGPGVLSFSQPSYSIVAPTNGAGTNEIITILRTNGSGGNVGVTLTTSNGTATAGINYFGIQTNVSFPDGVTNGQTVPILVYPQPDAGPATTVYLTLSNPSNGAAIGGTAQEVLTILNGIESFTFTNSPYVVGEGGTITLEIVRNGPATNTASVSYSTSTLCSETNICAQSNVDYVPASGTLTFAPNETFTTIPISTIQGNYPNSNALTFQVLLNNPSPAGVQVGPTSAASITILCDVTGFEFPTNSYAVGENGSNIVITVNRINPNTGVASVQYATSDGANSLNPALNASNLVDYVSTSGTLIFQNGQATNSFTIPILNQNIVESNKTFNVTLSNPLVTSTNVSYTNAYLEPPSAATVTITNVLAGVSFESPAYTVSECGVTAAIPVVLTGSTNNPVSVSYTTTNGGSAAAGTNYLATNGTLIFSNGQTVQTIYVQVINNHIIGPNHTVYLALSNPQGALLLNPSTTVLTIQECNGAYIVNAGTAFVSGSVPNSGGVIFSNETVTLLLGLRDVAGSNTTDLVATLQATNGVAYVNGAQNSQTYGVLITNGPTVARPFTFKAVGTNGQNISANLALQDGSQVYSNVDFGFTLGGISTTFSTNETLLLYGSTPFPSKAYNTNSPNYGYPSLISVSGVQGNVTAVTAGISNFGHTYPGYVDMVLEGPGGQDTYLMYGCGGDVSVQHVNLTFSQSAGGSLPKSSALASGTYLPTVYGNPLFLPTNGPTQPQAPLQPFPTNLSAFVGPSPNGTWSLFVAYDDQLDSGYISNGWSLTFSTGIPIESDSDLELAMTAAPADATLGANLIYSISVTNYGPAAATNVIITDTLPSGVTYVSNSANWVGTNGVLTSVPTTLAVSNGVTFNIEVIPNALGYITNIAAATANQPDLNVNNVQTNVVLVSAPSADMGVTLSGSPNPVLDGANVTYAILVTNNGPSTATGVTAINVLPAGFRPGTITPAPSSVVTNAKSVVTITWNLGAMGSGSSDALTIVAGVNLPEKSLPSSANLDSVTVSSQVYDPAKLNNYAAVKTEVEPAMINVAGSGSNYSLSWQAVAGGLVLEGAVNVTGPWVPIANPAAVGGQYTYVLPGTNGYHFFRLMSQLP